MLIESGVVALSSSGSNENSYSYQVDNELGLALMDRFTFYAIQWLNKLKRSSKVLLRDFASQFSYDKLHSNVNIRLDLWKLTDEKPPYITDFFVAPTPVGSFVQSENFSTEDSSEEDEYIFEGFKDNVLGDVYEYF